MSAASGTDLRLAPALLAAGVTAWLVTGPGREASAPVAVAGAVLGAVTLVVVGLVRVGRGRPARRGVGRGARRGAGRGGGRGVGRVAGWRAGLRGVARGVPAHLVLALACTIAVCVVVHVQTVRQAPLVAAASQGALAELTGTVASEPRPAAFGTGERWTLSVDAVTARGVGSSAAGLVEVTTPGGSPRYGATVVLDGVLRPAEPGEELSAQVALPEPVPELEPPGSVLAVTDQMRGALLDVTDDLGEQARGLVPGVAVGDTSRLPPDLDEAMRTTSLTHVTAVSGGHFAIVVAALVALCAVVRAPRAVRVGVVAIAAAGFVVLVRPEPSVLRAAWTCAVGLLGLALGRPSAGVPALGAAATALLVVDPWLARSYGFVLSCAATAGLVLLAGPLARRIAPWTGRTLGFGIAVPWAAQAACGPVLVLIDPRVPLASVPANLLAAPALVPATVLGLLATLAAPWVPSVAHAIAWTAGLATAWIALVARTLASLPSLPWPGGPGGALLLGLVTTALLYAVLRRPPGEGWPRTWREVGPRAARTVRRAARRQAAGVRSARRGAALPERSTTALSPTSVVLVAAAVAVAIAVGGPRIGDLPGLGGSEAPADWEVVACDVGQGDSLVVRTGAVSAVVVDVGPAGPASGRCLDRLGVTQVDLLVLSHFHADHVGGLAAVLAGRTVSAALVSPLDDPVDQAEATRSALAAAGVPVRTAAVGDQGDAGTVSWQVIGADPGASAGGGSTRRSGGSAEGDGANEASVAMLLHASDGTPDGLDVAALGDLEEPGQAALARALAAAGAGADVDVVKMAHHGSRSQSADLAQWLSPRVALVSVGADNTYGHPTRDAMELYERAGAVMVRTDECGTAALVERDGELGLACS